MTMRRRLSATVLRIDRSSLQPGLICVYTLTLSTERGDAVHTELAVVHEPDDALSVARTPAAARRAIREFVETREAAVRAALLVSMTSHIADVASAHAAVVEGSLRREHALIMQVPSARELVQSGLFDRRALRAHAGRQRAAAALVEASEERLESLASERTLRTAIDLSAILIAHTGGRTCDFETAMVRLPPQRAQDARRGPRLKPDATDGFERATVAPAVSPAQHL